MPTHSHGVDNQYTSGCRCTPCTAKHTRDNAARRRSIAYGTYDPLTDAHDTKQHIKQLLADGMTYEAIATAAGLNESAVRTIHVRAHRTHTSYATRIQAVTPHHAPPLKRVPAAGTIRRIQGLQLLGWSHTDISEASGVNTRDVLRHKLPRVAARTAQAVERGAKKLTRRPQSDLSDDKPATSGPRQVAAMARAKGWVPLMEWDDIDNPDETPKTARPPRAYHGRVTNPDPELIERIHRLHRQGMTDPDIARTVGGRTASSVQKIRKRNPPQEES
jgi:hypothetical protein